MTIDQEDHAPRPADDFWAGLPTPVDVLPHSRKLVSIILGDERRADPSAKCHQLGCDFSELPHC